jgi:cytochrome P450
VEYLSSHIGIGSPQMDQKASKDGRSQRLLPVSWKRYLPYRWSKGTLPCERMGKPTRLIHRCIDFRHHYLVALTLLEMPNSNERLFATPSPTSRSCTVSESLNAIWNGGLNLLTSQKFAFWKGRRKGVNPAFTGNHLRRV